jgi:TetR/AcrR family transcriptional regulator, cholesterol catabolism regulator
MAARSQPVPRLNNRRAEICRTAARIIRERGYDATSVNDIARALGMTKAGLYHYFCGKDALLFEIMSFGMDQIDAEVVAPIRGVSDPEERLRQLLIRHARIATRAHGAVAHLTDELRALPPPARRKIKQRMRAYFDLVRDTLAELKAAGRLRDVDLTVAAFTLLGMILWPPRWFRQGRRLTSDQVAVQVAQIALAGLLRPQARARRPTIAIPQEARSAPTNSRDTSSATGRTGRSP